MRTLWSRRSHGSSVEPPIELRFVDLFMILMTTLIFIAVILSIISAAIPRNGHQPGHQPGRAEAPRILTRALPDALQNRPYQVTLAAAGGTGVYQWQLASGRLPSGLRLHPDGLINGTPRKPDRTVCAFRVQDGEQATVSQAITFAVQAAQEVSKRVARPQPFRFHAPGIMLPEATWWRAYKLVLKVEGGTPPYRWRLVGGKLPPGLDWSPKGILQGRPRGANKNFTFSMEAMDAANRRMTQEFAVFVNPARWQMVIGWVMIFLFFWFGGPGVGHLLAAWREHRRYR